MDNQTFAGLLAQVIPVALIAIILEVRNLHATYQEVLRLEARSITSKGKKDQDSPGPIFARKLQLALVSSYLLVAIFVILEMAALVAAKLPDRSLAVLFIQPQVSVVVLGAGFLFVQVFSALSTHQLYVKQGIFDDVNRRAMHNVIRLLFLVIVGGGLALLTIQ